MTRFAIIGFGFMGAAHLATIRKFRDARVEAIVESDAAKLLQATTGNITINDADTSLDDVQIFATFEDMIRAAEVDCVVICLPTFLHAEYSIKALRAGKHVVCEKPMALSLKECDLMISEAMKSHRKLFIAQCIRFWPEYSILKSFVESGELGRPVSFLFRRLSGPPFWGKVQNWFLDAAKSGGCVFDLHVHDVDFVNHLLGRPDSVYATGLFDDRGTNTAVMAQYRFRDKVLCFVEASWRYPFGFKMSYTAVFEKAKIEYDSAASPSLTLFRVNEKAPEILQAPKEDGYYYQYDYFLSCLSGEQNLSKVAPLSVRQSIEMTLAEVRSMSENRVVIF